MVQKLIELALRNRVIVLLIAGGLFAYGIYSIKKNPIDAIPDLSENQVIVFTEWMGRSPQVIEDQVTYPLVSNLQGIPKIKNIRGSSMFGMSFVYVIFEDNVDIYWARTRVLERLNFAQRLLPQGVTPTLGPDGTGVGHIYWYHLMHLKWIWVNNEPCRTGTSSLRCKQCRVWQRLHLLVVLKNNTS